MIVGERIKERRKELGLSADALAKMIGKNRSTIFRYENGDIENMPIDTLKPLAEALHTTPAYLMGWKEDDLPDVKNILPIRKQRFPLLGAISCGEPKLAEEDLEVFVEASTDIDADFALRAKGDSMIGARIRSGDVVFIKKMPMVENGEIAAVIIDDEATLKRLYYYREKDLLILRAENPKYQDLIYSGEELDSVHILGKAVLFQGEVK